MKRTRHKEWGPEPYNAAYLKRGLHYNISNASFRSAIVARYVLGESVLDLACGAGQLANLIGDRQYLGVDFSELQMQRATRDCRNPSASFALQDLTEHWDCEEYDTVVLGEIIEHLENPRPFVQFAIDHARRRVIATVPEDMPEKGHCWHQYTEESLLKLFGDDNLPDWAIVCHRFQGAKGWWRWLIIREIDGYKMGEDGYMQYVPNLGEP